jgi:hypothetical protein
MIRKMTVFLAPAMIRQMTVTLMQLTVRYGVGAHNAIYATTLPDDADAMRAAISILQVVPALPMPQRKGAAHATYSMRLVHATPIMALLRCSVGSADAVICLEPDASAAFVVICTWYPMTASWS